MKKTSLITLVILISIGSSLVYSKQDAAVNHMRLAKTLLWQISGNDLTETSYLYGTMHLTCKNHAVEKAKVQNAIDQAGQLYLEIDLDDPNVMLEMMESLSNNAKIKDIDDVQKKDKLLKLASKHLEMNSAIIADIDLFSLFSLLAYKSVTGCLLPSSVEEALISQFKVQNKNIEALETFAEQEKYLQDSGVMSADAIIHSLEYFEKGKNFFGEMTEVYFSEDIHKLYVMMTTPSELYSAEYIEKFSAVLLDQRNQNWVEIMPGIAKEQSIFFAVGAGHLPGDNGIIQLLREKGYKVEPVTD